MWVIFCLPRSKSRSSNSNKCGSGFGSTTLTSRQRITCINTPAVSEEVNALISGDKQTGWEAELCAPGFQLAQVRGTLAHVVNLQPHQLNLATLLSGGQCSDAYKKRLSIKNNEETPGFQLAQVRGTLAHVVHLHPHQTQPPHSSLWWPMQ